jgi:methylglyoxal synthase
MLQPDDWRPRRWRVALVADETRQGALAAFVRRHRDAFRNWELVAPLATGEGLRDVPGLRVRTRHAGSAGPEIELGAELAAGELDAMIYLRDPLAHRAGEDDGAALLWLADAHNVALAINLASAECLVRALAPEGMLAARGG